MPTLLALLTVWNLILLWYVYSELWEPVQDLHMCLASGTFSFPGSFSTILAVSGFNEVAIASDNCMMANLAPSDYMMAFPHPGAALLKFAQSSTV